MGDDDPSSAHWHLGAGACRERRTHSVSRIQVAWTGGARALCSKNEATAWPLLAFLS